MASGLSQSRNSPGAGHLKVCFAAALETTGTAVKDIRIAYGSVAPTVVRAAHARRLSGPHRRCHRCRGGSCSLERDIAPIDDVRSTARYRSQIAANLLSDFLATSPRG
jgi:xanthine dehydrogenase iron-sulfur cluster and FAD-binding subunit A